MLEKQAQVSGVDPDHFWYKAVLFQRRSTHRQIAGNGYITLNSQPKWTKHINKAFSDTFQKKVSALLTNITPSHSTSVIYCVCERWSSKRVNELHNARGSIGRRDRYNFWVLVNKNKVNCLFFIWRCPDSFSNLCSNKCLSSLAISDFTYCSQLKEWFVFLQLFL